MYLVILLLALAAPLMLLPVEAVWPYPHLVEEITKLVLVWIILKDRELPDRQQWLVAAGIGFGFAISETILYARNFLWLGSADQLAFRLVFTGGLHIGTALLFYFFSRHRWWTILVALPLAVAIHYFFNAYLGLS